MLFGLHFGSPAGRGRAVDCMARDRWMLEGASEPGPMGADQRAKLVAYAARLADELGVEPSSALTSLLAALTATDAPDGPRAVEHAALAGG